MNHGCTQEQDDPVYSLSAVALAIVNGFPGLSEF